MNDFSFHNDTNLVFGRGVQQQAGQQAKLYAKTNTVMLVSYEGRPLAAIMDEVAASLKESGFEVVEFEGVVPNPRLSKAREGIELARKHNVGLVMGVGGGSAADTAKAIAVGAKCEADIWDLYMGEAEPGEVLPVGVLMTLAGTGSESSIFAVLTNDDTVMKIGFGVDEMRPKFALLNPEITMTLPAYQTACGACDMFAHILDAYLGRQDKMDVTYRMSEAVMTTVVDNARKVMRDPKDYDARAQLMVCGTMAMGKFASWGLDTNLGLHTMAEDLGALSNAAHGATLSVLIPAWLTFLKKEKLPLLVRWANNVWGIQPDAGNLEKSVDEAIAATRAFFVELGLPVTLKELGINFEKEGKKLAERIQPQGDWGDAYMLITSEEAYAIYETAK